MSRFVDLFKSYNAQVRGLSIAPLRNQPAFTFDRLGHKVFLCRPQQIENKLRELELAWVGDLQKVENKHQLCWIVAKFYYDFLQIHPFSVGNERTALKFLHEQLTSSERVRALGYRICEKTYFEKIPFAGDPDQYIQRLASLLGRWLVPIQ